MRCCAMLPDLSPQWCLLARLSWVILNSPTAPYLSRLNADLIPWFTVHSRSILYESKNHRYFAKLPRRAAVPPFNPRANRSSELRLVLCRAYAGYVDIGARHLFFTFVESQGGPADDDVVILISGGMFG